MIHRLIHSIGLATILVIAGVLSSTARAEDWIGATGDEWNASANWNPATVPNAIGATATFPAAATVNLTSFTATVGTITASQASGSVVLGATTTSDDIISLQASSGTPTIAVSNVGGTIFMYANLDGTQGLTKTGSGKFTFRFNGADQTYSGPITISSGIFGINQDSSLGSADNDITIGNGARLLAEPSSNTGTITLPATRTITLAGAQSQIGSGNANVTLVVDGNLSETTSGNGLVKTDAGIVTLQGTLGYTGETRIAGGTLRLGGSALLPSGQNLRFNGATGTLDVSSTSQTVRTIVMDNTTGNKTITGNGGSLLVNGDANLTFTTATNGVVYNLSGLGDFTYDRSNREFAASANGANVTNTVNLAAGSNSITATNIRLGGGVANAAGQLTNVTLGTANDWNAGTDVFIGNFQGSGNVSFQSGLTSPSLTVRGLAGGTTPVPIFRVGNTSSGNQPSTGTLNLTSGSLDLLATELSVGYHIAGANTASNGTLTMPAGTVVASTVNVAGKTASSGTPTVTGTMNQSGGTVTADSVYLGAHLGTTAANFIANYSLTGGTLAATTIGGIGATFGTSTVRNLNVNGGTLRNKSGGDLSINGVDATAQGLLNVVLGASGGTLSSDAGQSITLGSNTAVSGTGGIIKEGAGTLVVGSDATYTGATTVNAGTLQVNAALSATSGVTLAAGSTLGGSGRVAATVGGAGRIGPGNSPGIMTALQIAPTSGLGFDFEFTQAGVDPTWSDPTASVNDVLRLTDTVSPFTTALGASNGVSVFLGVTTLAPGDAFTGGFFTDATSGFTPSVQAASYDYYVLGDGQGSAISYGGTSYYSLAQFAPGGSVNLATVQVPSASFASGTVTGGFVTEFTYVPEPASLAAFTGLACLAALVARSRRRI